MTTSGLRVSPGDGLLHPVAVGALVLLLVNDHVLKTAARGTAWTALTGKLSDAAGVTFLPILVVAGVEIVQSLRGRWRGPSPPLALGVATAVAVCFALMKTVPAAGRVYAEAMGVLQWPFGALRAALNGADLPAPRAVAHVVDPTDALAAPCAFWSVAQARSRARSWASNGETNASNSAR